MGDQLKVNVFVADIDDEGTVRGSGKFYGPDYPENEVTGEVMKRITNPAAFEDSADQAVDPHSLDAGEARAAEVTASVNSPAYTEDELDAMTKDELLSIAAARSVDVPAKASKDDVRELLRS